MKKQFLTLALLATVAVGGAFAGNSARVVPIAGTLNSTTSGTNPTCTQEKLACNPTPGGVPCTIGSPVVQYYAPNANGLCNVYLRRD